MSGDHSEEIAPLPELPLLSQRHAPSIFDPATPTTTNAMPADERISGTRLSPVGSEDGASQRHVQIGKGSLSIFVNGLARA